MILCFMRGFLFSTSFKQEPYFKCIYNLIEQQFKLKLLCIEKSIRNGLSASKITM